MDAGSADGGALDVGLDTDERADVPMGPACEAPSETRCGGVFALRGRPIDLPFEHERLWGLMQPVRSGWVWPAWYPDPENAGHLVELGLVHASAGFDDIEVIPVEGVPRTAGESVWSFVARFATDPCTDRALLPLRGEAGAAGFLPIVTSTSGVLERAADTAMPQGLSNLAFDGERVRMLATLSGGTCDVSLAPTTIDLDTLDIEVAAAVPTSGFSFGGDSVLFEGVWTVAGTVGCEEADGPAILRVGVDGTTDGPRSVMGLPDVGGRWTVVILPEGGAMAVAFHASSLDVADEVWVAPVDPTTAVAGEAHLLDLGGARIDVRLPHITAFQAESPTTIGWLYVDRAGPDARLMLLRFQADGTIVQRTPLPTVVTDAVSSYLFRSTGDGYLTGYYASGGRFVDLLVCDPS